MVTPLQTSRRFLGPGDKLGPYEVIRQIAIGGMAELYLARTAAVEGFERLVCVKRILPQYAYNPSFVTMFLNEAKLAATLHHPNIAQVYDIGQDSGEPFFAMEYVHGEDLGRVVVTARENGVPVSLDCALTLVSGLCAGLHHAHEKATPDGRPLGVVHRDVSPTNVLVSYDGAVKLVDFGIARMTGQPSSTSTGGLKGKISYMSPEQCRGNVPLDRRSDVFSVGTILYELTTGQLPFNGETEYGLLDQIVNRDAEPPSRRVPNYPHDLEAIVMRALSRDVDRRFATALDLQNELEDFAHDNRLRVSPLVLARLMSTLFPTRLEEWDHARAQGAFFVEQHVVRTLIESGRTPPAEAPRLESRRPPSALDEFSAAAYTDVAPNLDSGRAELPLGGDVALARAATVPAPPPRMPPPPLPPPPSALPPPHLVPPAASSSGASQPAARPLHQVPPAASSPGASQPAARPPHQVPPGAGPSGARPSVPSPAAAGQPAARPPVPSPAGASPPGARPPSSPSAAPPPRFSALPVPNMPGAVPIVAPLTAPTKASAGTLVSSALQAGTIPPALSTFGATNVFQAPPGLRATPPVHAIPVPPSEFGAAITARGRALGSGELPAGLPRRHRAPSPSSSLSSSSSSLMRRRSSSARPTLVLRVPRRHLWLVAALLIAGAGAGIWALATVTPGVDPAPAAAPSKPAAAPASPVDRAVRPEPAAPPADRAGSPANPVSAPAAQGADPTTRTDDRPSDAERGSAAPEDHAASANQVPDSAPDSGDAASDDSDGEPETSTPPARKRAGKAIDPRSKPARRPRPDSKRDPRRVTKPELKGPSWNDDSPFMPVQTQR